LILTLILVEDNDLESRKNQGPLSLDLDSRFRKDQGFDQASLKNTTILAWFI